MAAIAHQTKIIHLYRRAGFGLFPGQKEALQGKSLKQAVESVLDEASCVEPMRLVDANSLAAVKRTAMSKAERRELVRESRATIKELNVQWVNRMASGKASLREKMTLFWHGHFACRSQNAYFVQTYFNTLHAHALGKFGDLLLAVSKTPAMLQFLNNQQNRKHAPNENFAREVMELFTLGRGNYTEQDIKQAARAFTGWGFTPAGEFVFRERQHDFAEKTFLGETGTFSGEEVLQMLLKQPETARYLTTRIYTFLVNETPDEKIIAPLAKRFYQSGYHIASLLEEIFTADWFYQTRHLGSRIKSPVELLAGLQGTFGIRFAQEQALLFTQRVLGQVLFYPPNVAGWSGGRAWIDSASLLFRLQLPALIFRQALVTVQAKEEGDVNTDHLAKRWNKIYRATVQWQPFLQLFASAGESQLLNELAAYLLPVPLSDSQKARIQAQADRSTRETLIKSFTLAIIALPEYQLT